jgi:hypothetical protein
MCSFASSAFAWQIGGSPDVAPVNRKIVRVFREVNQGGQTFAAFVLSQEGGTGVSKDAIIVHDLGSPATQAVYQDLLKIYEQGDRLTYVSNNSRNTDTGNWAGVTTFYRIYASDYFYFWRTKG